MGDKKYAKLDPDKMGFKYRGVVPRKRQAMLVAAFEALKRGMGAAWKSRLSEKEIFWLNVWQEEDGAKDGGEMMNIPDPKIGKALDKWCRKAVRKYCEPKAIIDGYGFVINPRGSKKPQVWHVDYTTDVAVVWIPITPFTHKNAMQYLTLPSDTGRDVLERVASTVNRVDINTLGRGVDYLIVQQVIAKPMSVLYMGRGTIHRGIANTGRDHRVAFYITVHFIKDYEKNYPYRVAGLSEPGVATFED